MNRLFEDFVEHVVRWRAPGTSPGASSAARPLDYPGCRDRPPVRRIIPDLLVEEPGGPRRLAVDAKYKLYDDTKISVDDVSQSFLYAYAYARHSERPPAALLLFPSTSGRPTTTRLRIRSAGGLARAAITGIAIPIPALLAEMKRKERGPLTCRVEEEVIAAAGLHAVEEVGAAGIEHPC